MLSFSLLCKTNLSLYAINYVLIVFNKITSFETLIGLAISTDYWYDFYSLMTAVKFTLHSSPSFQTD